MSADDLALGLLLVIVFMAVVSTFAVISLERDRSAMRRAQSPVVLPEHVRLAGDECSCGQEWGHQGLWRP